MKIFCIYDDAAKAYLQPFFMRSKGEVIRSISSLVVDPEHTFCKHSQDFTLFELGSYDESSGIFSMYDAKQSLGCLLEFKPVA